MDSINGKYINMTSALNGFNPVFVIVGYTCVMQEHEHEMYLESGLVKDLKLQALQPMTKSAILEIRNAFDVELDGNDLVKKGWITDDILYIDNQNRKTFFIYYEPAGMQEMIINSKVVIRPKPTLIFIVSSEQLYVFASAENTKPGKDTMLYHCPFANTRTDDSICLGNATVSLKREQFDTEIQYWKSLYWKSSFTNEMSSRIDKSFTLKSFQKAKVFDPKWLVSTKKTLKEIIANG
jgi:PRTRC genetic system protein B